ncbi:sensor histidine kinase [Chloroflexota bacterium]
MHWSSTCQRCVINKCHNATHQTGICSHGYNYVKVADDLIIGGFVLREWSDYSQARKKRKKDINTLISQQGLNQVIDSYISYDLESEKEVQNRREQLILEYVQREQYKTDFLEPLKQEIVKGLSFVHDYKQINAQIIQNINIVIEERYHGASLERKLDSATRAEKTIYYACRLLDEKLNVAKLLINPQLINDPREWGKFRFHGMVTKYRQLYYPKIEEKKIRVNLSGVSTHWIYAHPDAVGIIPHTFIDNAVKYSLSKGQIDIHVQDLDDCIDFSVSSYGPRIKDKERETIFQPFKRGEAATKQEEEGAGYGLYISQLVATTHLDSEIEVTQDPVQKPKSGHWTTFSIRIPLKLQYVLV